MPGGTLGDMCGRYAVTIDPALLAGQIDALDEVTGAGLPVGQQPVIPNYNVAPTDPVLTVVARHRAAGDAPMRRIRAMRWGLIPSWTKARPDGRPLTKGAPLINARAETLATAAPFRASARAKRCLVPMDGWYEWRTGVDEDSLRPEASRKSVKTPFYMCAQNREPLFAAGLWSVWKPQEVAEAVLSAAIITVDATGPLRQIHDRMPLLLGPQAWDSWLDPDAGLDEKWLHTVIDDPERIRARRVSTLVNSVRNNGPELLRAADTGMRDRTGEQITLL